MRQPFANARNVGDLTLRIAQNIGDAFGITFNRRSAIAVAADAKAVFPGDFHQVGSLPQQACDLFVLQTGPLELL